VEDWLAERPDLARLHPVPWDSLSELPERVGTTRAWQPPDAMHYGWQATVETIILIDTVGVVREVTVCDVHLKEYKGDVSRVRSPRRDPADPTWFTARSDFERNAIETLEHARFRPGIRNGRAVSIVVYIPIGYANSLP